MRGCLCTSMVFSQLLTTACECSCKRRRASSWAARDSASRSLLLKLPRMRSHSSLATTHARPAESETPGKKKGLQSREVKVWNHVPGDRVAPFRLPCWTTEAAIRTT